MGKNWRIALIVLVVCLCCPASQGGFAEAFRARTARVKITPEELGWLGGYGHRNRPAEGVAADQWARVPALKEGRTNRRVLESADIHIFTRRLHREIVEAARTRFGLAERDLIRTVRLGWDQSSWPAAVNRGPLLHERRSHVLRPIRRNHGVSSENNNPHCKLWPESTLREYGNEFSIS
jgi:hypothetical protein